MPVDIEKSKEAVAKKLNSILFILEHAESELKNDINDLNTIITLLKRHPELLIEFKQEIEEFNKAFVEFDTKLTKLYVCVKGEVEVMGCD